MSINQTAKAAGLFSTIPRKVVILAAEPMQADGTFAEFEKGMYLGGHTRMEAAVRLAKIKPETEFIIVGGYNRPGEGQPKVSDKVDSMATFLRTHVNNPRLELVRSLPCTHHNFIALHHYLQTTNQHPRQIGLLTSGWQIVRAMIFAQQSLQLFRFPRTVEFIPLPGEAVLGQSIDTVIGNRKPEFQTRLATELRGLGQIFDGSYEDSCLKHSPGIIEHVTLALL